MRIECKNCHQTFGEPSAPGGIFTILPAAVITGIVCGLLIRTIDGWAFLVTIPLWLFLSWVLWELLRWLTRSAISAAGARVVALAIGRLLTTPASAYERQAGYASPAPPAPPARIGHSA